MKWVAFIFVLAAVIPLSVWLRGNPREVPKIWMLMGFLPFVVTPLHLYMAFITYEWSGYLSGAEFSVLDALSLALYISLPGKQHPLPFRLSMILYFLAVMLSVLQADIPIAALFYPWQLARMFLVYAIVTRAAADPRVAPALLRGMAAGLLLEAGVVIWQRFGLGMLQTRGTFDSQNLLGMVTHLIVFPFFALLLAGERGKLPVAIVLAGIVVELLTISRATLGIACLGFAALFMFSALRQWTSRKAVLLAVAVAMSGIIAPLASLSLQQRFGNLSPIQGVNLSPFAGLQYSSSVEAYDERAAFEKAAAMMFSDNPLGVGANHYSYVANNRGYNAKAGVAPMTSSEFTNVHNIYWLVAVETGYPGLITFLFFLLSPLVVAFLCGWRHRRDQRGDLLLGLGIALLAVYVHSNFEWIFITSQTQYIFAMDLGLVAGLAQQLGYWRRSSTNGVRLGVGIRRIGQRGIPGEIQG